MRLLVALLLLAAVSSTAFGGEDQSESAKKSLKEANKTFTYNGKPIHPGCVNEFSISMADSGPPVVRSVDVASCMASNEFAVAYKVSDDGYIGYEYEDSGEKNYFGYKYVGKAKGGIHILDTMWSGGGTMVAKTVFLTRFGLEKYRSFDDQGKLKLEKRLIMKCIGQIVRGDRDIGTLELKNDKLILGESQYRKDLDVISLD